MASLFKDESQRNRNQIAEIVAVFNHGQRECQEILSEIRGDEEEA